MDIAIIKNLASVTGLDGKVVFEKLCDYIIGFFDPEHKPVEDWTFDKKVTEMFYSAFKELIREYNRGIGEKGWCDPLGSTFESLLGTFDASNKAQFFTPESLCDLMAELVKTVDISSEKCFCGAFGYRYIMNDPTGGSGRNLLAAASKYIGKQTKELPYFVSEDIDPLCCKMSAINLMFHGLPGEVICHDTLAESDTCRFGYIINERTYPIYTGIPSIRRFTDPLWFVTLRRRQKQESEE